MDGTTFGRSAGALLQMAGHPAAVPGWVADYLLGRTPLQRRLPWLSHAAISFLRGYLKAGMRVFEFGVGGSTLFFLDQGCSLVSLEASEKWSQLAKAKVQSDQAERWELRVRPLGESPENADAYYEAMEEGSPWDVILVDGCDAVHEDHPEWLVTRPECLRRSTAFVKSGGIIVLDDSWRADYAKAATEVECSRHLKLRSLGPCRMGVTQTDIFLFE